MQVLGLKIEDDDEEGGSEGEEKSEGGEGEDKIGDDGGSPLQKKLTKMAFDITKLGFAAAAFGAILAAILWLILKFGEGSVLAIVDASGGHRRMLGATGTVDRSTYATCDSFTAHRPVVKQAASFWAAKMH
jgi:hypothetical protein